MSHYYSFNPQNSHYSHFKRQNQFTPVTVTSVSRTGRPSSKTDQSTENYHIKIDDDDHNRQILLDLKLSRLRKEIDLQKKWGRDNEKIATERKIQNKLNKQIVVNSGRKQLKQKLFSSVQSPNTSALKKQEQERRERSNSSKIMSQFDESAENKEEIKYLPVNRTNQNEKIEQEQRIFRPNSILPKVSLQKQKTKTRNKTEQSQLYFLHKNRYLDYYNERKNSLNKTITSRKTSRSRSLSPECEMITQRLYRGAINKQPCNRYEKQKRKSNRTKMNALLKEYTFLKRYLTQNQITDILYVFDKEGLPQYKWPMKLVSIIQDKLKRPLNRR